MDVGEEDKSCKEMRNQCLITHSIRMRCSFYVLATQLGIGDAINYEGKKKKGRIKSFCMNNLMFVYRKKLQLSDFIGKYFLKYFGVQNISVFKYM